MPSNPEPAPVDDPAPTADRVDWWRSFVFRFIAIYTGLVIALFAVLIVSANIFERHQIRDHFGALLRTIVANTAPGLDGDLLVQIRTEADGDGEAFRTLRRLLAEARGRNGLDEDLIYALRPVDEAPGVYAFAVMLQARSFIGDRYRPPPHLRRLYTRALAGEVVHSRMYEDENGAFISGIAPIRDGSGAVVGLLQADFRLAHYLDAVRSQLVDSLLLGAVLLLLLLFTGHRMHRHLQRHIALLLDGTAAIRRQIFDHRVPIQTRDELAVLADAINQALDRLQERSEMMRFLPHHTQEMITRVLDEGAARVGLSEAREIDVVVLETDIRGFTALSESLSPAETIALVNRYIEVQAEQVLGFGGSIDKYMGDAVLVIFEGPDRVARALACAAAILQAVERLNQQMTRSIQIGVGASMGPVVMGNMGCDARMEHTVIGPTVNLAARLCSAARGGELVVQEALVLAAAEGAPEVTAALTRGEAIRVKGFSAPIQVRRARVDDLPG